VGINSAIYAPNGAYAGYSFAIPVNLVKKIINDLIQFGDVKRGFIGVNYPSNETENERLVKQNGQAEGQGVYVSGVSPDGAASKAGLKKGDIIIKVNENPVNSGAEMSAQVASYKPGDKINVSYLRSGKELTAAITLKESAGDMSAASLSNLPEILGAELVNIDKKTAAANNVEGGVKVKEIKKGGPLSKTRMEKDFIITSVNGVEIKNIDELTKAIAANEDNSLTLDGFYEGYEGMYRYPVNLQ
jgi:S1-C subfamily serine protease